ncbi:MAG: NADH-quinone oxidoreductase subunit NuoF [Planctomycetes bacterium]|nr:NADH-quinone oxidoreductase subunit NuoF [Planctomycetota bacterium]
MDAESVQLKDDNCTGRIVENDYSVVAVCLGTGGIAAGGENVFKKFEEEIKRQGLDAVVGKRVCKTAKTGCRGLCSKDVLVDVSVGGLATEIYERVTVEMVPQIVEEHLIKKTPVTKWLVKDDYHKFHDNQYRLVLGNCGIIDPDHIEDYIERGGYKALKKVLETMTREEVIEEIKRSGLRGRGGGGFPTGQKWASCTKYSADETFIICNADEGDPGAFMDRSLMEGDPHAVLEGMIIGGYAINATSGYIYVRAEYPMAVKRMNYAIIQAKEHGFLGKNILGSGYGLDIIVKEGAGAFVCGESTALQYSIEGKRGMPRTRPPQSVEAGLWDKPTVLNNVETLANVPIIINRGADWYSKIGTEKSKGTKIFSLTGKIKNPGLIEVPMGTTIRQIVFDMGGGIPKKRRFKAVQIGGPSGGCLPESLLDSPIDYESLLGVGAMMGSGSFVVVDDGTCMVELARFFMDFCARESCGKCPPCRIGTTLMLDILTRITQGKGEEGDIPLLEEMCGEVKTMSLCGLGQSAPNPIKSTLRYFRDEYIAHIRDKICPTATCIALHKYEVASEKCTKCQACIRNCPVKAISGSKTESAFIDKTKCIKCNLCYEKCNFMAIK